MAAFDAHWIGCYSLYTKLFSPHHPSCCTGTNAALFFLLGAAKQQIIDDWKESAQNIYWFRFFYKSAESRTRHRMRYYRFSWTGLLITLPHYNHTGVFLTTITQESNLHLLRPHYCLNLLVLIRELASALTVALGVSHSR